MQGLDSALNLLAARLNVGLLEGDARQREPLAVLANPADGTPATGQTRKGRLVLTLVAVRNGPRQPPARSGEPAAPGPEPIEAEVLLTAVFPGQYARGVGVFTNALEWLHANPVLPGDGQSPEDAQADAISLSFVELSFEEAAHVVGLAGVKGMPFALYRLRGIALGG